MIAFVDIDEVLVDFIGAAMSLHGIKLSQVHHMWPETTWSASEALGWSNNKFWKPINEAGAEFWENLVDKPWINDILFMISGRFSESYLVSAPSLCPTSYTGKVKWIRNRFGSGFDKFILTPHKELLAAPDRILIDDNPHNVQNFRDNGGQAVLFPFWGNENRKHLDNPVNFLRESLDFLRDNDPYLANGLKRCDHNPDS